MLERFRRMLLPALLVVALAVINSCRAGRTPTLEDDGGTVAAASLVESPELADAFWERWGDGKAELIGYELKIPRYGEVREGTAVTIFVTETFSNELRVKADPGKHADADQFPVMKLNLVQDFPTGIYDYNVMTSSFLALRPINSLPAGSLTKVSFTSQEWCGHVYAHLLFSQREVRHTAHSYFDGEADQRGTLSYPENGISEHALWFWARGFAAPKLEPGESVQVPLLMSLQEARFAHQPLAWRLATLSRSSESEQLTVPGGDFAVEKWTAQLEPGPDGEERRRTFYVEAEEPYRIIKWEASDGEVAELLASDRLAYWKMNSGEYRDAVKKLGLPISPPRSP